MALFEKSLAKRGRAKRFLKKAWQKLQSKGEIKRNLQPFSNGQLYMNTSYFKRGDFVYFSEKHLQMLDDMI